MKKMIAVIAVFGMLAASQAYAADKLIVQDAGGANNVMVMTDGGMLGVNAPTPLSPIDVANPGGTANSPLHFSRAGADSGGWITSDGENNFWVSSGAKYVNGAWVQKATTGQSVFFGSGAAGFTAFLNQGATVGGAVTASAKFRILYDGKMGLGTLAPKQLLEVNGGVRLNTATAQPTCDATNGSGTFWFTNGGAGVKDSLQVCAKDAAGAYAWRTLY